MTMLKCVQIGLVFTTFSILGIDIGSDTSPGRFNTQQVLNTGDRIAGFAALSGGFVFFSITATATFDSTFPISGSLDFNGGTLVLNQDLILQNTVSIRTLGSIFGKNHVVDLGPLTSCTPTVTSDCRISLVTNQLFATDVRTADWSFDDEYIAVGTQKSNTDDEFYIYAFNNQATNPILTYVTSLNLDNEDVFSVRWHPTLDLIGVGRASTAGGDELLMYSLNRTTSALTLTDSVSFNSDVTALAWHPTGNYIGVGSKSNSQEISVYPVSGAGVFGTPVTVNLSPNRDVNQNAISWSLTGTYLAVGTDQALVYTFQDNPSLALTLNASVMPGDVTGLDWNHTATSANILAVGIGNNDPRLRLYAHNAGAGTLTEVAVFTGDFNQSILSLNWAPEGVCLIAGKSQSSQDEVFSLEVSPITHQITQVSAFAFPNSIRSTRWSRDGDFALSGGDDNLLTIYARNFRAPIVWTDVNVFLGRDICIQENTITFSGHSSINGQGNCLELRSPGSLRLAAGATLLLKDITITGVRSERLEGVDNASTFTFENAVLILDNDYTFSIGHLDVKKELMIRGNNKKFIYATNQRSVIEPNSQLILDENVIFNYAPNSNDATNLSFVDATSELVLNGATLIATTTGLHLLRGSLVVDLSSSLSTQNNQSGAIIFGDGVNTQNNFEIVVNPAAELQLLSGFVEYANV